MKLLIPVFIWFAGYAGKASAHVGYVLEKRDLDQFGGMDLNFLVQPLTDPMNLMRMGGTVVGAIVLYFLFSRLKIVKLLVEHIDEYARSYHEFMPWMARLSVGIALIGAGTENVLLSPILPNYSDLAFAQILIGFLLLSGLLLSPATLAALGLYIYALYENQYMFGSLDLLALLIVLLAWADPRPGIDDLIGISQIKWFGFLKRHANRILCWGIGGAMMFLAVYEKLMNPHLAQLVVERFKLNVVVPVSPDMWVLSAGLIEFAVGLALFIGFRIRLVSAIAFLVLTLSFFFFKESVYSHVTLFGILSILFTLGSNPSPHRSKS